MRKKEEYDCEIDPESDFEICINKKLKTDPFELSQKISAKVYLPSLSFRSSEMDSIQQKKCNHFAQYNACFNASLTNALKYTFLFLLASFVTIFLHEFTHFIVASIKDIPMTLSFSVRNGFVELNIPTGGDVNATWIFFLYLAPLIFVECGVILYCFLRYHPKETMVMREITFQDNLSIIFVKTIALISVFLILYNALLIPILNLFVPNNFSNDILGAWEYSFQLNPYQQLVFQFFIILVSAFSIGLALFYFFLFSKQKQNLIV